MEEIKITLNVETILTIDDAKKSDDIDILRNTTYYREMLQDMDKEPGRTHEQNVKALDEVFRQTVMHTPALTPQQREVLIQTFRDNN